MPYIRHIVASASVFTRSSNDGSESMPMHEPLSITSFRQSRSVVSPQWPMITRRLSVPERSQPACPCLLPCAGLIMRRKPDHYQPYNRALR
jgi:hypothetical protein